MRQHRFIWPLSAVAVPYIIFEMMNLGIISDFYFFIPMGHFYIVSFVSVLASIISIAIGVAGARVRNIQVIFLALSFLSLALMFLIHGLSTPNFIYRNTHLPGISAQLSMLLASIWICLSSLSSDNKFVEFLAKWERMLLPLWTSALIIFGIVVMIDPFILMIHPASAESIYILFTFIVLTLNGITMFRYYKSYRYSRFPLQIAIVYISGLFMASQLIMVRGEPWKFSWWIYHFLLFASMIIIIIGLYKQYAVKGKMAESLKSLFTNDPFERITNSMAPSVKALVTATEKKDTYTAGHTFRVTMYALRLGEELQLKPEQLRAIVQGGLVHDVGKIKIPDEILNKRGKLTHEERRIIEKHPVYGYNLCRKLGFMKEELGIIRSHHEKWDGTGYPDRLKGREIPYFARIVAVVDVYDALTSERAYRKAWTHFEAIKYLKENKETHFDPKCVDAWERLCSRDPSVYQIPAQSIKENSSIHELSVF